MRSRYWAAQAARVFLITTLTAGSLRADERTYKDLYVLQLSAPITVDPSSDQEAADGGQVVSEAIGAATDHDEHAMLWSSASGSAIDLNPRGFTSTIAMGTDGSLQVGDGSAGTDRPDHAMLWYGTAASAVDLNPLGFTTSIAYGTDASEEVGSGTKIGNVNHALLWRGSAKSAIDLNPKGFTASVANGTNGKRQIGEGLGTATGMLNHALFWSGAASSVVDLNPTDLAGFRSSFGLGIGGWEEVGYGVTRNRSHQALLWHGSAASAVDLNPTGFAFSVASGTNGSQQVGYGYGRATDDDQHALLWSGSADSYVDLGALLPSKFTESFAFSINAAGDVFGYAQEASGAYDAIEWREPTTDTSAPEPGGVSVFAIWTIALQRRRRRDNAVA